VRPGRGAGGDRPATVERERAGDGAAANRSGFVGAVVVGVLSLALIGGLWLAARGAPSAAGVPTLAPPTATLTTRERFGVQVFPTVGAIIRRQPAPSAEAGRLPVIGAGGRGTAQPTASAVPTPSSRGD
jgi:hypothetical protein